MSRVLTRRQLEVCAVLVGGVDTSNKEIAAVLGVRENTVKRHVSRAMLTARVHSRIDLIRWLVEPRRADYYLARFRPLPEAKRGHHADCGCSVCFVHGRQDRRQGHAA